MKKLLLTATLALLGGAASAATATVDGMTYTYAVSGGAATITKAEGDNTSVTIPSTLGGATVTRLADGVFKDNATVTSVAIPDSVSIIGNDGFNGCEMLATLIIPNSVKSIGGNGFKGCHSLTHVELPEDITTLSGGLFAYCSGLVSVKLPSTLTSIGSDAFNNCTSLAEINFPDGLKSISYHAFVNCVSLKSVAFPRGFSTFYNYSGSSWYPAFNGCSGLQNIVFAGSPPSNVATAGLLSHHCVFPKEYGSKWIQTIGINSFTGYSIGSILTMNVISSSIRENDPTIMDVVYKVTSKKPTVKVRVLAFEDGERSFAKVVRPETFVTDTNGVETACNVGDNVTPNVEHTISWRVSSDWTTKLAKVKFEVLACEGELLPLELMTIPASDQYGKMKISWNAISSSQCFDALLWLYADKTADLTCASGVLKSGTTQLASGTGVSAENAMTYIYGKMGYLRLIGAPLTYANSETRLGLSPSGARQYAYKIVEE